MKSARSLVDIPLMGIRTGLIKLGIGPNYFERSRNPLVRAHATLRLYRMEKISLLELAEGIMRDCLLSPQGGINITALNVYQNGFIEYPLSPTEKSNLSVALDNKKLAPPPPRVAMSLFTIKRELGLFLP